MQERLDGRLASLPTPARESAAAIADIEARQATLVTDHNQAENMKKIAELEAHVDALLKSTSWRITRPLRFLSSAVGRVRQ